MKNFFLGVLALLVIMVAAAFFYRYQIIRYSADKLIRSRLPDYIRIEKIDFDAKSGKVVLKGLDILNPSAFSNKYLMEIEEASCSYRMKTKAMSGGFEILDAVFKKPLLNIERLGDGRVNLAEMQAMLANEAPDKGRTGPGMPSPLTANNAAIMPADFIKLPDKFLLKGGKIVFIDRFQLSKPLMVTFEDVDAEIALAFDGHYSRVLKISSAGEGDINGRRDEAVKWDMNVDPTAPRLTMSSRFDVSGVEITQFEPYYDKYSPLIFRSGIFSGTLVFDFNNGNIGSTNEIRLKNFKFDIKPGYENARLWETTVPDLVKYFSSPYGEIVFDFKIKGSMQNPQFYLGPISKQAIASMAIDKISSTLEGMSKTAAGAPGPAKSDLDKAKEYIDLFKGMMKK